MGINIASISLAASLREMVDGFSPCSACDAANEATISGRQAPPAFDDYRIQNMGTSAKPARYRNSIRKMTTTDPISHPVAFFADR